MFIHLNNSMSLEEVIKDNFNQILMTEGVEVINKTENKSFYGLVSSGELNAVFTVID